MHSGRARPDAAIEIRPGGPASDPLHDFETIDKSERLHFRHDVADFQNRRLGMRPQHEASAAAPALDETRPGELVQHLAHGHPRAAILRRQFVLEGDTMARRPIT